MGYELARAATDAGHCVMLVTASMHLCVVRGAEEVKVESACDMFEAVKNRFGRCDCLIMAAAVADYTPIRYSRAKLKKGDKVVTLKMKPTPDILKWAGSHKRRGQIVIGFALDDRNIKDSAERKQREKHLDIVVANTPAAIGADKSSVWIKPVCGDWVTVKNKNKAAIAARIIDLAESVVCSSKQGC